MRKIVEFTTAMVDGGAETLIKDYAILLDKEQFEVLIVTLYDIKDTANSRRIEENNIRVVSVYRGHNCISRIGRTLLGRWYIPYRLKKIFQQEKPDCIHAHLRVLRYLDAISDLIKKMQVKILYTCHNLPEYMLPIGSKEERACRNLIQNNGLKLIALHNDMAQELENGFHVKCSIIRNGIDFEAFRNPGLGKKEVRKSIGIPEEAYVIGNIGRFSVQKNQLFLLKILKEMIDRGKNAFLLLIGSGEKYHEILAETERLELSDRVVILSHRTDIPQLLKAMDAFVFPSLFEGLPVTLVEAQAAGLRCVISSSVNDESVLSKNTVKLSLEENESKWCDAIFANDLVSTSYGDLESFNMRKEIKMLETLYLA